MFALRRKVLVSSTGIPDAAALAGGVSLRADIAAGQFGPRS
jgi:hypothetical protein